MSTPVGFRSLTLSVLAALSLAGCLATKKPSPQRRPVTLEGTPTPDVSQPKPPSGEVLDTARPEGAPGATDGLATPPVEGNATPEEPAVDAPALACTTLYVTASSLNVRPSPGVEEDALFQCSHGTRVEKALHQDGWAVVSFNGKAGFLSTRYLSCEKPKGASGATCTPPKDQPKGGTPSTPTDKPTDKPSDKPSEPVSDPSIDTKPLVKDWMGGDASRNETVSFASDGTFRLAAWSNQEKGAFHLLEEGRYVVGAKGVVTLVVTSSRHRDAAGKETCLWSEAKAARRYETRMPENLALPSPFAAERALFVSARALTFQELESKGLRIPCRQAPATPTPAATLQP